MALTRVKEIKSSDDKELEALECCARVAQEWGVGEVRPCVGLVYQGVDQMRKPYGHVLSLELITRYQFTEVKAERILYNWNSRLSRPLFLNELMSTLRQAMKPNAWPYSCKHQLLSYYCIGDSCPFAQGQRRWKKHQLSSEGFTCSGWLAVLTPYETALWFGCYRLARLKGRGPRDNIKFTFRELERHCHVRRSCHRKYLTNLRDYGLIDSLKINDQRGGCSQFRFPEKLPDAHLTITKPKE